METTVEPCRAPIVSLPPLSSYETAKAEDPTVLNTEGLKEKHSHWTLDRVSLSREAMRTLCNLRKCESKWFNEAFPPEFLKGLGEIALKQGHQLGRAQALAEYEKLVKLEAERAARPSEKALRKKKAKEEAALMGKSTSLAAQFQKPSVETKSERNARRKAAADARFATIAHLVTPTPPAAEEKVVPEVAKETAAEPVTEPTPVEEAPAPQVSETVSAVSHETNDANTVVTENEQVSTAETLEICKIPHCMSSEPVSPTHYLTSWSRRDEHPTFDVLEVTPVCIRCVEDLAAMEMPVHFYTRDEAEQVCTTHNLQVSERRERLMQFVMNYVPAFPTT